MGETETVLVGRERELAILRERLAAALAGRGSLALIGGEAGVGKTSLAEAALVEAALRGALVLTGRCYDLAETPPYGPWIEAFALAPRDAGPALPPDLGRGGMASQAAYFAQAREYVAALAARTPLVLFLDDLQWADPASLDLLRFLARQGGDLPLLLIATYRDDELTRRHSLSAVLPLLEREGHAARIDLRRLDGAALRALVGRYALPQEDAIRLVAWLAQRAEGNAFFTVQLLRALESEGVLARVAAGWTLGDVDRLRLPPSLRQVLDRRLARLGEDRRRLLALASVIGQEVPLATWAIVAGSDEEELLTIVDAALEARLVLATPDGAAVRFAHALIREALYEGVAATRRRHAHRRVGEALAATPTPDPDAVAHHFRQAGDARAAAWLIRAGERAQRAFAYRTATARYASALALLADDEAQVGERGWLHARLAWLRDRVVAPSDLALVDEAARLAARAHDPALTAATLFVRGWLLYRLGEIRPGLASLEAAAKTAEALTPAEQARLNRLDLLDGATSSVARYRSVLVRQRAQWGPFAEVVALGERRAAEAPPPLPGPGLDEATAQTVGGLYDGLAIAHALLGHPAEAAQAFAGARAAYRAIGHHVHHFALGATADWELSVLALPYHPERIAARRRLASEIEAEFGHVLGMGLIVPRAFLVPLLVLEGAWTEARTLALAHVTSAAQGGQRRTAHTWLGILARAQGEPELAWAQVRELFPDGPVTLPDDVGFMGRWALGLPVGLALDASNLPLARQWLACYDRWLAWSGAVLGRAEGQLLWSAYYQAANDVAQARACAESALALASEPRQSLALLAAHRLLGELDLGRGDHAAAGTQLEMALALAEACAAPYERALTLLARAELRAAMGKRDAAQTDLGTALAVLEPLAARPALARAATLGARLALPAVPPFGLTMREVEVLRLVAEGLSDAQIADRLFLSRHTVKTHLRTIYGKLDVPSRTAAARLARDHGVA